MQKEECLRPGEWLSVAQPRRMRMLEGRQPAPGAAILSSAGIVANMARGWNRTPSGVVHGSDRTGVSAALRTSGDAASTGVVATDLDPVIGRIGREMLAELREQQPLIRLRVDALGQDLAIRLLRGHSNLGVTRTAQASRGGLAPWYGCGSACARPIPAMRRNGGQA